MSDKENKSCRESVNHPKRARVAPPPLPHARLAQPAPRSGGRHLLAPASPKDLALLQCRAVLPRLSLPWERNPLPPTLSSMKMWLAYALLTPSRTKKKRSTTILLPPPILRRTKPVISRASTPNPRSSTGSSTAPSTFPALSCGVAPVAESKHRLWVAILLVLVINAAAGLALYELALAVANLLPTVLKQLILTLGGSHV